MRAYSEVFCVQFSYEFLEELFLHIRMEPDFLQECSHAL